LEKRRLVAKSEDLLQIDADQVVARESDTVYERDNIKYNKEKSLSELESKATERTNEVKIKQYLLRFTCNYLCYHYYKGHFHIQSKRRPKTKL